MKKHLRAAVSLLALLAAVPAAASPVYVYYCPGGTTTVCGTFGGAQPDGTPNYGNIDSTDARWTAYQATLTAQATAAAATATCNATFAAGAIVTNTAADVPEAVGTWDISPAAQHQIISIEVQVDAYQKANNLSSPVFPPIAGVPSGEFPWQDLAGTVHMFTSYAHWLAWGVATGGYTTALTLACNTAEAGGAWSPPTNSTNVP